MTVEEKVAAWMLKQQVRGLQRDTGHGFVSAREVAAAFDMKKGDARIMLERMAGSGKVLKMQFTNGLFWRTANPLPWEPGGAWPPGCVLDGPAAPDTVEALLRDLAALKTDEDLGGDMSGDKAASTLSALIERARALA